MSMTENNTLCLTLKQKIPSAHLLTYRHIRTIPTLVKYSAILWTYFIFICEKKGCTCLSYQIKCLMPPATTFVIYRYQCSIVYFNFVNKYNYIM